MFARIFRLLDRFGRLIIKSGSWAGERITSWAEAAAFGLTGRVRDTDLTTDSARAEGQVRSLSGLIVILLAGLVVLVLWATSPQAQNNPVIRLLSVGGTPASDDLTVATPRPALQGASGTFVFSMWAGAQQDLFALSDQQSSPVRLTNTPEDDRDPVWSPDGQRIAFTSRRDGNWELYTLILATGEVKRLTYDLVFEANPSWSPDSQWIAYEGYNAGNLDIYVIQSDGTEGPYPVTNSQAPDFAPAWRPNDEGREIAYVSLKDGTQDIYIISLDDPRDEHAVNITNTPSVDENEPVWGLGGDTLAYSAVESGVSLIYTLNLSDPNAEPRVVGSGRSPAWSPDGNSLVFLVDRADGSLLLTDTSIQAFPLPAIAGSVDWSAAILPHPLPGSLAFAATAPIISAYEESVSVAEGQEAPYRLMGLSGVIAESDPVLSDRVDGSFIALKDYMNRAAGWDFLGRLAQVWWGLTQIAEPGQQDRNWHKTGRAFDIIQSYNNGTPPQIEVVQERIGAEVYWRIYVRCAVQDGTLGEPLRRLPWDFAARTSGNVAAYDAGGQVKGSVPSGYYVDFTRTAQLFGWYPVSSDSTWRYNWPGIMYWQYEKRDGLDWWSAMLELYPESGLRQVFDSPIIDLTEPVTPMLTPDQAEDAQSGEEAQSTKESTVSPPSSSTPTNPPD